MMKRRIWVIVLMCLLVHYEAMAVDILALADSVGRYVAPYASVGKMKVNKIRVKNQTGVVDFTQNLSWVPMHPGMVDTIHAIARHYVFRGQKGKVLVMSNGFEVSELVLNRYLPASQQRTPYTLHRTLPLVHNTSLLNSPEEGLAGIHLAVWGSHGLYFNQPRELWIYQRPKLFTTVEDLFTSSFTMPFLVPMLENAGAVVLQPRERDIRREEVVIDESDGAQVRYGAVWTLAKDGGWGRKPEDKPLIEGDNPFRMGGYAQAKTTKDAGDAEVFTYLVDAPKAGEYAVYVSYKSFPNSTEKAHYTVYHSGVATSFEVNQRMGGGTWIYLGSFAFGKEREENRIEVSTLGDGASVVSTDAVKIGGGMGSVARYKSEYLTGRDFDDKQKKRLKKMPAYQLPTDTTLLYTSGMPRYMEGARYWLQYAGMPDSVYNIRHSTFDYADDCGGRGRWVNYLSGGSEVNPRQEGLGIPIHLSLGFHTDAGVRKGDSVIGSLIIRTGYNNEGQEVYPTGVNRLAALDLGDWVQSVVVEDMRRCLAPEWSRRALREANYAETRIPEVPAIILELLSHQNFADMRYGLDPRFRFVASRAVYKGIVRYIHAQYGTPYCIQPLPVQDFGMQYVRQGSDSICLHWAERVDSLEATARAEYYILYTRTDDGDWDNGVVTYNTSYTMPLERGVRYDFRIVAANKGGVSLPSETLSAYLANEERGRVLIINGFTRVGAPNSFELDSTYAGFHGGYGVPWGTDIAYIGEQWEFERGKIFKDDNNAGFGSSYADKQDQLFVGNTFAYPTMHGKVLQSLGYSYLSCAASAVDSISGEFDLVDVILGLQKETVLGTEKQMVMFKPFEAGLRKAICGYTAQGGCLLVSGSHISEELQHGLSATSEDRQFLLKVLHCQHRMEHGSRSGVVQFDGKQYHLQMEPSESILYCEETEGLTDKGKGAAVAARYVDSGVCAGVSYKGNNRTLMFGFPLESVQEFESIYSECIQYLFH